VDSFTPESGKHRANWLLDGVQLDKAAGIPSRGAGCWQSQVNDK